MSRARASWSRHEAYAAWFASPLGRAYEASIRRVIEPWLRGAAAGRPTLDAGCGPILTFADSFDPSSPVVAVDCSFEVARAAAANLRRNGRRGVVVQASVDRLPLASGRSGAVVSVNCLEFVPDVAAALRELHRAAAPGAAGVVAVLDRRGPWEWTRRAVRPFRSSGYYAGRFLADDDLSASIATAGWELLELRRAVGFPPVPLPWLRPYGWIERIAPQRLFGVLLARMRKPAPANAERP